MLDAWLREVAEALGHPELALSAQQQAEVLDLARVVAHSIARPGAPLTTFLAGYLAGLAGGLDGLTEVTGRLAALAEAHGAGETSAEA